MILIVGLGNPGEKYKNTYHNIGFLVIDEITKILKFKLQSSKSDKRIKAEIIKGELEGLKLILIKPHTFMNLSGQTVSKAASYYKIKPQDIWVISDDIYLPLDKIRIRKEGSSGGHNGLESIISELGTNKFVRFRIGISKPEKVPYEKYVLQKIKKNEEKIIKKSIKQAVKAIDYSLKNNIEKTMDKFN